MEVVTTDNNNRAKQLKKTFFKKVLDIQTKVCYDIKVAAR